MATAPGRYFITFVFIAVLLDMTGFRINISVLSSLTLKITGESLGGAAAYSGYLLDAAVSVCRNGDALTAPRVD